MLYVMGLFLFSSLFFPGFSKLYMIEIYHFIPLLSESNCTLNKISGLGVVHGALSWGCKELSSRAFT